MNFKYIKLIMIKNDYVWITKGYVLETLNLPLLTKHIFDINTGTKWRQTD